MGRQQAVGWVWSGPIRWQDLSEEAKEALVHVVPEVAIGYIIQRMFGKKNDSILEMTAIHTLSIPFIGSMGYLVAPDSHPNEKAEWSKQFQAGLAGVPAVVIGRYILSVFEGKGFFQKGGWDMRQFLVAATSKIITRPVISALTYNMDPGTLSQLYASLQKRFDRLAKNTLNWMGDSK